jgi:hypothetical protein
MKLKDSYPDDWDILYSEKICFCKKHFSEITGVDPDNIFVAVKL